MTCHEILGAMATGRLIGRWRARRHVARCPRCAAVVRDFKDLIGELSAVPELKPAERRLWLRALEQAPAESSVRTRAVRPAFGVAMATLLIVIGGSWLVLRLAHVEKSPTVVEVVDAAVGRASSLQEVEEIRAGVVALGRQLDQLERDADLLDVRRDADALGLRFAPRTAFNGF